MEGDHSELPESVPASFFAGYETIEDGSDMEMAVEEGLAMDYDKIVEEEGLQHLIRVVPLGSRLEPLGQSVGFVEKILLLKPADPDRLVDIDTLVIKEDLTVLGKVLEVFGPVEAPMYSVLCHREFVETLPTNLPLFFLPDQAAIVQTGALRAVKCTDGDGEGGQEEFYSDDEAEAEARRKKKQKPKRKVEDLEPGEIDE